MLTMEGITTNSNEFIKKMKKLDVQVLKLHMVSENRLKVVFNENKEKIEDILIILKKQEKKQ